MELISAKSAMHFRFNLSVLPGVIMTFESVEAPGLSKRQWKYSPVWIVFASAEEGVWRLELTIKMMRLCKYAP